MTADPKNEPRVRDVALLRQLHREHVECEVTSLRWPLSLHHINKHPRDDVRGNLVMVHGDGTTGFHGLLEANDVPARQQLGMYITHHRPDTLEYLLWRFPRAGQAAAWLERRYLVGWPA